MRTDPLSDARRRLLLLGAASLALHLLALVLIAPPAERAGQGAPRIAVTLLDAVPAPAPAPFAAPAPAPLAAPASKAPARALPKSEPAPLPQALPAPAPVAAAPVAGAGWSGLGVQDQEPIQMPGRYSVRPPPAALLTFAVTRTAPGAAPAPAGEALIDWRIGAGGYSLRVEGVSGALYSRGAMSDAGIAPAGASETLAGGALAQTSFDEQSRRIGFSASARSYRLLEGSQDRASLLLQLAGIGLAEPEQVKDVLEFYVGAGDDAGVVRFQVVGPEEIDSALGKLASVRLVQLAAPGQPRLEVWLAPGRHWLPVQLRVTAPDGSALTQLVTGITER